MLHPNHGHHAADTAAHYAEFDHLGSTFIFAAIVGVVVYLVITALRERGR